MIVTRTGFHSIINQLLAEPRLALDTETTGLRAYHGDRLFSIIISTEHQPYYFNFKATDFEHVETKEGVVEKEIPWDVEEVLTREHLFQLRPLFMDPNKLWYIQNAANFDLSILGVDGFELQGEIHCTKAIGRVEYNEHRDIKTHPDKKAAKAYSLEAQLFRLGHHKDDKVAEYVSRYKLQTNIPIPGKDDYYEAKHYDKVPRKIMVPYGCTDGKETFFLGDYQEKSIAKQDLQQPEMPASRSLGRVMRNERRLQKTIYRMRHRGVLVDLPYCKKASAYETDRGQKAKDFFKRETGRDYSASAKLFESVFADEKSLWGYTDKGNPSFESDYLARFANPAAKAILDIRDSKSKADFYNGFMWFADRNGVVHPNFNPEGTVHGRFSSSEPNFQNLTSEEDEETIAQEFVVRRALIPRPGYVLIMPDYDQMEYKFMLEQACRLLQEETELAKLVIAGHDFHEATGKNAERVGSKVVRKEAKIANFLTLYGGGIDKLAEALRIQYADAKKIRQAIFKSAPEISAFIDACKASAEQRGYVINWLGRRSHFPNSRFSYRAPNYIVSGGCADVVKVAMNEIDELTLGLKSKMVMSIHDELPMEIHESELATVPYQIKEIMESVYQSKYIPLTTGMEWSDKSLGDKKKGFPV